MTPLLERLKSKEATMSVVGLGYVGLPIALAFAKHLRVVGFDIHKGRVDMMKRGEDPSEEVPRTASSTGTSPSPTTPKT
jgi:UDP-N-acetyl-D-galactosamine dehydrogenase